MPTHEYSEAFVDWIKAQRMSRRAASARDILLERGTLTTAELYELGYDHPPRAVRDLKDAGATVETRIVTVNGKRMAQYTLIDTIGSTERGRRQLSKSFREELYRRHDYRCAICDAKFAARELQTDHRIPFAISGDPAEPTLDDFMPLCGSDNRAKSWSCEHCPNWVDRNPEMCSTCYWARPDSYAHVAGQPERRLTLTLRGAEVPVFDGIQEAADAAGITPGEWVRLRLDSLLEP